ncbi:MAG: DedA family protein [Persephonella sp.]|nr:MAG: DedA family protein [Persephonella sp.]RUM58745.1 MAG: DedA family protein [Persephonella sp.]
MIENVELFFQNYGYIAVFIGTFLEGEIFLIVVGIFIKLKLLNPALSLVFAILGAFIHEILYFFVGKWKGKKFLEENKYTQKSFQKAKELLNKYGVYSIFLIRFLYGMRMVPMMLMGASGIGVVRFTVFNLISLLIWAILYLALGYFFGHTAEMMFGKVKEYYFIFIISVIAVITLIVIYPFLKKKLKFR